MKNKYITALAGAGATSLALFQVAVAQDLTKNGLQQAGTLMETTGQQTGLGSTPLPVLIGRIISIALGFLGVIFLVLAVVAGYRWMMAGGDTKAVDEAKTTLKNSVIGLVIVVAAYAISSFVVSQLALATTG